MDIRPDRVSRANTGAGRALYEKFTQGQRLTAREAALLMPRREDFTALWRYLAAHTQSRQPLRTSPA